MRISSHRRARNLSFEKWKQNQKFKKIGLVACCLKGRGCRTATVDLTVEESGQEHALAELLHVGRHHRGRVGARKGPAHVAGGVTHM